MEKEIEGQIRELQIMENTMQSLLMQKQALQFEQTETENALAELSKTKDEVYKIAGNIMIRANKEDLVRELNQKRDIINLRLKTVETQEKSFGEEAEKLRKKVLSKIQEK